MEAESGLQRREDRGTGWCGPRRPNPDRYAAKPGTYCCINHQSEMMKLDTPRHILQLCILSAFLMVAGCKGQSSLPTLGKSTGCTPTVTRSVVKEYWDTGKPKVLVEYNNDKAVHILELYTRGHPKFEIYNCDGEYGGLWAGEDEISPNIAQLELEIETLENQYAITNDTDILGRLNELKKEAVFYWETSEYLYRQERGEQYARDIYEYYKSLGEQETVTRLREVMYPMGYKKYDGFIGDEAYLTYPYSLSRLAREQVIVHTGISGQVSKVYWYDKNSSLRRIHLPPDNLTLFIEKYGLNGSYALNSGTNTTAIYGGTFDDFNISYRGGAGLSDIGVNYGYLARIIETTEDSINCLEEVIRKYEVQTGTRLTESQFWQPADSKHPLMVADEMNLAYLFDGHGYRLVFNRMSPTEFSISSVSLERDREALEKIAQDYAVFGKGLGIGLLIWTCSIYGMVLAVVGAIVVGLVSIVRRRVRRSKSEYL